MMTSHMVDPQQKLKELQAFTTQLRSLRDKLNRSNGVPPPIPPPSTPTTPGYSSAHGSPARPPPPPPSSSLPTSQQTTFMQQPTPNGNHNNSSVPDYARDNLISQLQRDLQTSQSQLRTVSNDLHTVQVENQQLKEQNTDFLRSIASVETQVNSLLAQREQEHSNLRNELSQQLHTARMESDGLRRSLEDTQSNLRKMEDELHRKENVRQNTIDDAAARMKALSNDVATLSSQVTTLQKERAQAEEEFALRTRRWREEIDALHNALAEAVHDSRTAHTALQAEVERVRIVEHKAQSLVESLHAVQEERNKATEELRKIQHEFTKGSLDKETLEQQLSETEATLVRRDDEVNQLKSQLHDVVMKGAAIGEELELVRHQLTRAEEQVQHFTEHFASRAESEGVLHAATTRISELEMFVNETARMLAKLNQQASVPTPSPASIREGLKLVEQKILTMEETHRTLKDAFQAIRKEQETLLQSFTALKRGAQTKEEESRARIQDLTAKLDNATRRLQSVDSSRSRSEEDHRSAATERDSLRLRLGHVEDELVREKQKVSELEATLQRSQSQLRNHSEDSTAEMVRYQHRVRSLEEEIRNHEALNRSLTEDLNRAQEVQYEREQNLSRLEREHLQLNSSFSEMRESAEQTCASLRKEIEKLSRENVELKRGVSAANQTKAEVAQLRTLRQTGEEEIRTLRQQLATAEQRVAQLRRTSDEEKEIALAAAHSQIRGLQNDLKQSESLSEDLRKELQANLKSREDSMEELLQVRREVHRLALQNQRIHQAYVEAQQRLQHQQLVLDKITDTQSISVIEVPYGS